MRKLLFFLLTILLLQPAFGATPPAPSLATGLLSKPVEPSAVTNKNKKKKPTLFQKAKLKILTACQSRGFLVDGEMTERQKRQGKWAMILGLGSLVLLVVPTIGLLAIPAAITGLVLGIKSVEGNSNTNGIIGIIASGLTLLLLLVAIAVLAAFFASWN